MGLMSWLRNRIGSCASRTAEDKADTAISTTTDAIVKSRSIRAQLAPFMERPDPFLEVFRRTRQAKMFEARVELETPRARLE